MEDFQRHFEKLRVAKQKTPEHVVPLDEMPRTPAGKIKKEVLRRTLSATPHEGMKDG